MKKIVIFGTGVDGRRIFRKEIKKNKVISFLDNNRKLQNKKFFNIPITKPDNKNKYLKICDQILVGGRYSDDQIEQLKKFIDTKKIIKTKRWDYKYSEKEVLFRNKLIIFILKKILRLFKELKVEYFIDGSSLLAIKRRQTFGEFTDIDIALKNKNIKLLKKKIIKLKKFVNVSFTFNKKNFKGLKKNDLKQIILTSRCNVKKREPVAIELYPEYFVDKKFLRFFNDNTISIIPRKFRQENCFLKYENLKLSTVKDTEKYLIFTYGKGWKKKHSSFAYKNLKHRLKNINEN